ncbi:ArsR family transcriptional regulator [Pseudomonas antarctica]|uniref:ArsR family transcriptional regulator n=1 Tax=Pseudomonas antarctica TaxID=219572 RepID=A0A172Z487_9PSED|nr:DUF1833 family protein [Pseudomonas antarctica]ANF87132.1 ArsR family transcriptional regulator [Pseudomonas antarctica]
MTSPLLNRLYSSGGTEIIHPTLEITDGSVRHFLTNGYEDLEVGLESGLLARFIACSISVALPKRGSDGKQDLKFALCNIDGSVSGFLRAALRERREINLVYREYISTDLSYPSKILRYKVKSGSVTATEAQIVAGYFNLLETLWLRYNYTGDFAPGMRYQ